MLCCQNPGVCPYGLFPTALCPAAMIFPFIGSCCEAESELLRMKLAWKTAEHLFKGNINVSLS